MYSRALNNIRFVFPKEEEEKETIDRVKIICNLNRAACQIKLKNYSESKLSCDRVLLLEKNNVKALYRRAQALSSLNNFEKAIEDIIFAIKINPNDNSLRLELKKIKESQLKYNKETEQAMSKISKKMFSE